MQILAQDLDRGIDAYLAGNGIAALADLEPLAEKGDADAQMYLANIYRQGLGSVPRNLKEAVIWYRKSARQGHAGAQTILGAMYQEGTGVSQDYSQAILWYRKAADQGKATAQNNLGVMYDFGLGVEQDYDRALFWYRKAADQGDARAQTSIGAMYDLGLGIPQDFDEAMYWYRQAADQGHDGALNNLGGMYEFGKGIQQDVEHALLLYQIAAHKGSSDARKNFDRLQRSNTPSLLPRKTQINSIQEFIQSYGGEEKSSPVAVAFLKRHQDAWIELNSKYASCAEEVSAEALLSWADLFWSKGEAAEMSVPQFMARVIIQLCEHPLYVE
jgi:TPR repeat protein